MHYMWFPKWLAGVDETDSALGGGPVSNWYHDLPRSMKPWV